MIRAVVAAMGVGLGALAISTPAQADFLIGLTNTNSLMGLNMEWNGASGGGWITLGAYEADTGFEFTNMTGLLGYRWYNEGGFDKNGYFGGLIAGDLNGDPVTNGYGAGGEMGYQWVTQHLRMSLHGGLALVEGTSEVEDGEMKPMAVFGATINLRY